uniref:Uncharacterized protein n=1 Tax=viral metagenome TaxID=1070528 RepID=A0A6M3KW55_9ZZZZ
MFGSPFIRHALQDVGIEIKADDAHLTGRWIEQMLRTSLDPTTTVTLTAAQLIGGLIVITDTAGDCTATLPTAVLLKAALAHQVVGSSIRFFVKNGSTTEGRILTISAGVGNTLSPTSITLGAGESVEFIAYMTAVTPTFTVYALTSSLSTPVGSEGDKLVVTAVTVGSDQTYTAAAVIGGYIRRACTGDARADLLPTAANILLDLPRKEVGYSFEFFVENYSNQSVITTPENIILTKNTGVTIYPDVTGQIVIRPGEIAHFIATVTGTGTTLDVWLLGISKVHTTANINWATAATLSGNVIPTAAQMVAGLLQYNPNGTNRTVTTDTAVNIIAALGLGSDGSDHFKGASFAFSIENTEVPSATVALANLTLTAGVGVTLDVDSVTIYPGQLKTYLVVVTSATTVTLYETMVNKKVLAGSYSVIAPATAAANDILAAEAITGVTQNLFSAIDAQPVYPRTLRATLANAGGDALPGSLVTVTGLNANGVSKTETLVFVAGTNGETADSKTAFATITALSWSSQFSEGDLDADETVTVGSLDVFGLPTAPNAVLLGVHKCVLSSVDADGAWTVANDTVGTADEEFGTVTVTTASNGDRCFMWLYTFI